MTFWLTLWKPKSWDATENILNQCLDNSEGNGFNNDVPNGAWSLGDEWYWIHMNNTVASAPPLDVDDNADRYVINFFQPRTVKHGY